MIPSQWISYSILAICVTYVLFPSPLPSWFPLYGWAFLLAALGALSFRFLPLTTFYIVAITCLFSLHVTRRYVKFLKQPSPIYDLSQYLETSTTILPTSRTQAAFAPAPALTRAERKSYLESLKHLPRREGGNDFSEVTLEEALVNELTPLGKSFLLPTGTVPSVPGLYVSLEKSKVI